MLFSLLLTNWAFNTFRILELATGETLNAASHDLTGLEDSLTAEVIIKQNRGVHR